MTYDNIFNQDSVKLEINSIFEGNSPHFGSDLEAYKFALSILDLTTLEGSDKTDTIEQLCSKAIGFENYGLPNVAAVCVYPVFVRQARELLKDTNIRVASVAGAFPSGQSPLHIKLSEIQYAIDEGADEIDMVISRGKFLEGKYQEVGDEINDIKSICKDVHLKIILETGELNDLNMIYHASMIAMEAGGDFIKTSTGKIPVAATPEASYVMLKAIKEHKDKHGKMVGFKPAGGISTPEQAFNYIKLIENILGKDWLSPEYFRIGASRLANNLLLKLTTH